MAFPYARIRDAIANAVDQLAQDAVLRVPADESGTYREVAGSPVDHIIRCVDKKNVLVGMGGEEGNVAVRERHIVILNKDGDVPEPTRSDIILLGGESLSIARVMDTNPGGTSIVYTCVIED